MDWVGQACAASQASTSSAGEAGCRLTTDCGPDVGEERRGQLPAGAAVDAALVDEPVPGGVGRMAQVDAGHAATLSQATTSVTR